MMAMLKMVDLVLMAISVIVSIGRYALKFIGCIGKFKEARAAAV